MQNNYANCSALAEIIVTKLSYDQIRRILEDELRAKFIADSKLFEHQAKINEFNGLE